MIIRWSFIRTISVRGLRRDHSVTCYFCFACFHFFRLWFVCLGTGMLPLVERQISCTCICAAERILSTRVCSHFNRRNEFALARRRANREEFRLYPTRKFTSIYIQIVQKFERTPAMNQAEFFLKKIIHTI